MKRQGERSLTVLVVDVSPVTWGRRDLIRTASDRARSAKGKPSVGPANLDDLLSAIQAFSSAFSSLERDSALILVAVAGSEVAVVHPRKDEMENYFANPETILDSRKIQSDLVGGVAELVSRAASKQSTSNQPLPLSASLAAMASAFSISLCLINRFLVATNSGVSALRNQDSWNQGSGNDEGVITALSGGGGGGGGAKSNKGRAWSPRILLIQASDDRPSDYNAFMNCAFASVKQNVVVDGCFIPATGGTQSSPYLEQTCDLTGGLWLAPKGAAQSNKALTEVLLGVFLPPRSSRSRLNLPDITKVDFRARSFDTGDILDMAFVCNQCLSIFKRKPVGRCPTCDAEIRLPVSNRNKQQRIS
jgi:transcription initiation factor TFIIH subunit 3